MNYKYIVFDKKEEVQYLLTSNENLEDWKKDYDSNDYLIFELKKLKMENKELIEYAIEDLILCADYSKTLTSGNVSHVAPALEGRLRRTAEYLGKHYKEIENVLHQQLPE